MGKDLNVFPPTASWDNKLSSSEEFSTLIEVLKALNLGTLIPTSLTFALVWKLYGFFNELSEKLTKIDTKIDGLKDLLPYKIKEALEQEKKKEDNRKKHNPRIEKTDWAETIGVTFGTVDLIVSFSVVYKIPALFNNFIFWVLFIIPGLLGILPVVVSEKRISKENRAKLSLVSLLPWAYLILVELGIILPVL